MVKTFERCCPIICYPENGQGNPFTMQVWARHSPVQLSTASATAIQNLCPGAQGHHFAFSPNSPLISLPFCPRRTDCWAVFGTCQSPPAFSHLLFFFFFLECSSLHISSRFVLYHQRGISYPHHLSNRMLPTFLLFILLDFFSPFISISIPDIMICICLVVYMMSPPTRMSTFREQEFCMFYSLLHLIV